MRIRMFVQGALGIVMAGAASHAAAVTLSGTIRDFARPTLPGPAPA